MKKNSNVLPIAIMFFLFAMISFVTGLQNPMGIIAKAQFEATNFMSQLGNAANFIAYAFLGLPAGLLLKRKGYKFTALAAVAVGFIGVGISYISGIVESFYVYLLGAFVSGFSMCMLNTVVNPMLNTLGGGGNKGNQLIQFGGALNSLSATIVPVLAGFLIGRVTAHTQVADVNTALFIAMGIFAVSFIIILISHIPEPELEAQAAAPVKDEMTMGQNIKGALSYKHFIFGIIAIFLYVGIEVGIPNMANLYMTDAVKGLGMAAGVAGTVVGIYWFLMLVGRLIGGAIGGKVSAKKQLTVVSSCGIILLIAFMFMSDKATFKLPEFLYNPVEKTTQMLQDEKVSDEAIQEIIATPTDEVLAKYDIVSADEYKKISKDAEGNKLSDEAIRAQGVVPNLNSDEIRAALRNDVPFKLLILVLCGLCTSVMWGTIFNLAVEGLGKFTSIASGLFMVMVCGGGILPLIQGAVADGTGFIQSYWVLIAALAYLLWFALMGSKVKKTTNLK